MRRTLAVVLLSAIPLTAQARPDGGRAPGSATKSSTHRVVVVNGETVVDERTEDGVPVGRSGTPAVDPPALPDLDAMLREMQAKAGLPAAPGSRASSSHTRRVVVVNGETVVDEETRDGVPVRGRSRPTADLPSMPDLDALIRDAQAKAGWPGARSGGTSHAEAHAESSADAHDSGNGARQGSPPAAPPRGGSTVPLPGLPGTPRDGNTDPSPRAPRGGITDPLPRAPRTRAPHTPDRPAADREHGGLRPRAPAPAPGPIDAPAKRPPIAR
jgi:hypothetical protein